MGQRIQTGRCKTFLSSCIEGKELMRSSFTFQIEVLAAKISNVKEAFKVLESTVKANLSQLHEEGVLEVSKDLFM